MMCCHHSDRVTFALEGHGGVDNQALGATSILVTHDVPESFAIADYVYFLANGTVLAHGTPAQLRESVDPTVRQFIDGAPDGPFRFHYPTQATLAADFGLGERT